MRRVLALLLLAAAAAAGGTTDADGPFAVDAVASLPLRDEARGKDLQVRVTFPRAGEAKEKHPVLVFSHGMYGTKDAYQPLVRFWASHGYVCLQTNHPDSLAFGPKTGAQAVLAWEERPKDVSFLVGALPAIEEAVPALAGRVDRERVAVGGHSFGAHTAQLVGGVRAFAVLREVSYRDERVRCVLCISPQGPGGLFREESWKTFTVPAMLVTGSNDESPLEEGKGAAWRERAYALSPPGGKYLVFLEGAHHGFGGITGRAPWKRSGPADPDQVRVVKAASLAFLDAHLRGSEQARAFLASGALRDAGERTKVRFESK